MFIGKYRAKTYRNGQHVDVGPWLQVVRASGIFGVPTSVGPWWAGGEAEEYPDARIIHEPDGETVTIVATTDVGDAALRTAVERLGWA